MDFEQYLLTDAGARPSNPALELLCETVKNVPSASAELALEAWNKPLETAGHVVQTVGTSALLGTALGAFVPSRGPAELMTGLIFATPIVLGEFNRFKVSFDKAYTPGADIRAIGHDLAKGTISDSANIGLGFVGGAIGGRVGHKIATSDTFIGESLQQIQRKILRGENAALMALDEVPQLLSRGRSAATAKAEVPVETPLDATAPKKAWFAPNSETLNNRLNQVQRQLDPKASPQLQEYYGQLHGHSRYSDGTGLPKDIFKSAKDGGQSFYSITDHNHLAARDGVKPSDPRHADQAGTDIIAANPIEYSQTFADARALTEPGKFVGLTGVEMGTIGKVGGGKKPPRITQGISDGSHTHEAHDLCHHHNLTGEPAKFMRVFEPDGTVRVHAINGDAAAQAKALAMEKALALPQNPANKALAMTEATAAGPMQPNGQKFPEALLDDAARSASHYGGVNHINLFEVPQFFEAIRQPRPKTMFEQLTSPFRNMFGAEKAAETVVKAPEVIKYNDGDYKAMVDHLDRLTDTTGKRPVIQLNHPRFNQDWDSRLDPSVRGRDFGIKSFKNIAEWRERFGKYASQIEVITGEALNPSPNSGPIKSHDLGPINMAGYIDKGLHLSPTFGRDDHFALPNASPAGTGILAESLTKEGILDALRARRTSATTSTALLRGHMIVNETHPMGTILDQAAVNDLNIKMNIGGKLDAGAKYKVSLYADTNIGDGTLAKPVQVKEYTGMDLRDTQGTVLFDPVKHKIGNSSAWYVEVQRTDASTKNVDYLWTAPVWVEPLAGRHSLLTQGLVGTAGSYLLGAAK